MPLGVLVVAIKEAVWVEVPAVRNSRSLLLGEWGGTLQCRGGACKFTLPYVLGLGCLVVVWLYILGFGVISSVVWLSPPFFSSSFLHSLSFVLASLSFRLLIFFRSLSGAFFGVFFLC